MSRVIAIANQKGGVGKTTTCASLGAGLVRAGKKVLLIDADPQANLTSSICEFEPESIKLTLKDNMKESMDEGEILEIHSLPTKEGMDLVPANLGLADIDIWLLNALNREKVLKTIVDRARERYDYILIDCLPSLGMLMINALVAADSVIIPMIPEKLSLIGLQQLLKQISKIQKSGVNSNLKIEGILFTMLQRNNSTHPEGVQVVNRWCQNEINVFDTIIPRSIKAAETTNAGVSILTYDRSNPVAKAYTMLTEEVLKNG